MSYPSGSELGKVAAVLIFQTHHFEKNKKKTSNTVY